MAEHATVVLSLKPEVRALSVPCRLALAADTISRWYGEKAPLSLEIPRAQVYDGVQLQLEKNSPVIWPPKRLKNAVHTVLRWYGGTYWQRRRVVINNAKNDLLGRMVARLCADTTPTASEAELRELGSKLQKDVAQFNEVMSLLTGLRQPAC